MRRLLAALLAVTALAACSSSPGGSADRLSLEATTTTAVSPAAAALAGRLPTTVLDGFTRTDAELGNGPLDLEAAATSSNDPASERQTLRRRGFVRGVSRSWVNGASGDTVYVAVYEFTDPAGAAGYATDQVAALTAHGATPFPGGFTTVEQDGGTTLTTHAAMRQVGIRWALVLVASQKADRLPAEAVQVAGAIRL